MVACSENEETHGANSAAPWKYQPRRTKQWWGGGCGGVGGGGWGGWGGFLVVWLGWGTRPPPPNHRCRKPRGTGNVSKEKPFQKSREGAANPRVSRAVVTTLSRDAERRRLLQTSSIEKAHSHDEATWHKKQKKLDYNRTKGPRKCFAGAKIRVA